MSPLNKDGIEKLARLVGKLTLKNEFLKKGRSTPYCLTLP
jgi:hypothetical protein